MNEGVSGSGRVAPGAGTTGSELDADDRKRRERIQAYFSRKLDQEHAKFLRLRTSTLRRKIWLIATSLVILLAVTVIWLANRAGRLELANLAYYEIAGAVIALGIIAVAFSLRVDKNPPSFAEIEHEIDTTARSDVEAALTTAGGLLVAADGTAIEFPHRLFGYPDAARWQDERVLVKGRIGQDGVPRFTPVAVLAVDLRPDTIVCFEGAVDLATGQRLSERLIEFTYRDIVALERSSSAVKRAGEKEGGLIGQMIPRRARRTLRDKDTIAIHLAGGQSIGIVLRDAAFYEGLKEGDLDLATPQVSVDEFWQRLRAQRLAALASAKPSLSDPLQP